MREPSDFCTDCGLLRGGVSHDGGSVMADGTCAECGEATCTWDELREHLGKWGYTVQRTEKEE